jgi:hypothetical protein
MLWAKVRLPDPACTRRDAPTVVDKILQDVEAMFVIFAWQGAKSFLVKHARL